MIPKELYRLYVQSSKLFRINLTHLKKKYKILIVDDDVLIQKIWTTILTAKGYAVATSFTAINIFNTVEEHAPDIILMDHQMPVVSGLEAIQQLKASLKYRSVPVIFFSSVFNLPELASEAGADVYVSKSEPHGEVANVIDVIKDQLIYLESRVINRLQ